LPAAGNRDDLIGPRRQLVGNILNQQIDAALAADDP